MDRLSGYEHWKLGGDYHTGEVVVRGHRCDPRWGRRVEVEAGQSGRDLECPARKAYGGNYDVL